MPCSMQALDHMSSLEETQTSNVGMTDAIPYLMYYVGRLLNLYV